MWEQTAIDVLVKERKRERWLAVFYTFWIEINISKKKEDKGITHV